MKILVALIVLALLLAGGYWKAQNPDAGLDELKQQAQATAQRFQRGIDVVVSGGDAGASGDAAATRASEVDSRLAALESTLGSPASNAAATSAAEPAIGAASLSRLDAIEASLVDVQRGNDANLAGNDTTMAAVDALTASVESVRGRLDEAFAQLEESGSSAPPSPASASAASVDKRFAELDTRIATLAQAIKTSEAAAGKASRAADQASIDALRKEISEQIASLDSNVAQSNDAPDVDSLTQSLQDTSERIESLELQVQTLPASATSEREASEMRASLQEEISALEERLTAIGGETDAGLVASIEEIKAQIDQLANQGEVTPEQLAAQESGRSVEYKIYFNLGSTEITRGAAEVLDSFVVQEKNRTTGVSIYGLTDRTGPAEYNQLVADKRARNVQSYLIRNGFDSARITAVTGLGEDAAASVLDDEQTDAQQRAVVLFAAQQ